MPPFEQRAENGVSEPFAVIAIAIATRRKWTISYKMGVKLSLCFPTLPPRRSGPLPDPISNVDLSRFRSGQVLMLSGLPFKSHGAFPAQG